MTLEALSVTADLSHILQREPCLKITSACHEYSETNNYGHLAVLKEGREKELYS